MKYSIKVPPSKTEQTVNITIPDLPTSVVPVITGTTPLDPVIIPPPIDPPPPVIIGSIEGFGKNNGGNSYAPINISTAADIMNKAKSNTNLIITKGGTYVIRMNFTNLVNFTLDGSQADGPVIFDNRNNWDCLSFETAGCHDIIVKGIAFRNAGNDCSACNGGAYKVAFDHCSFSNGGDGSLDITNSHDISVQWCIIGNSKSGASLIDYSGTKNVSVHHNLYVGGFERNPLIGSQGKSGRTDLVCDFVNNIVFGWDNYGTDVNNNGTANIRNNYYYSTSNDDSAVLTAKNSYGTYPQGFAYVAGNVSGNGIDVNKQSNHALWPVPAEFQVTMQDACSAAKLVLAGAGPVKKDAVDLNFIKQVVLTGCQ